MSFAHLTSGSFFGETGLVFSDRRMSNVKAIGVVLCYMLDRIHLDNELKVSSQVDAVAAFDTLKALLDGNRRRNESVGRNMAIVKDNKSKLSKLIVESVPVKEWAIIIMLRKADSWLRIIWDILCFICLLYYCIAIPFELGYIHGVFIDTHKPFLAIDFAVDAFWLIDIYFRSHYMPVLIQFGKFESDPNKIWSTYFQSGKFTLDCISSLPLEIFALIPAAGPMTVYALRLIHLLRVSHIFYAISALVTHLDRTSFK
jgi:hypothetical protein